LGCTKIGVTSPVPPSQSCGCSGPRAVSTGGGLVGFGGSSGPGVTAAKEGAEDGPAGIGTPKSDPVPVGAGAVPLKGPPLALEAVPNTGPEDAAVAGPPNSPVPAAAAAPAPEGAAPGAHHAPKP
jgi:hypothetical protein